MIDPCQRLVGSHHVPLVCYSCTIHPFDSFDHPFHAPPVVTLQAVEVLAQCEIRLMAAYRLIQVRPGLAAQARHRWQGCDQDPLQSVI